jgi:hypothetical protein
MVHNGDMGRVGPGLAFVNKTKCRLAHSNDPTISEGTDSPTDAAIRCSLFSHPTTGLSRGLNICSSLRAGQYPQAVGIESPWEPRSVLTVP